MFDLSTIHRLSLDAARFTAFHQIDFKDAYDTAWHHIALHLIVNNDPTLRELKKEASSAVWREVNDRIKQHGYRDSKYWNGQWSAPRFCKYWVEDTSKRQSPPWEESVLDTLAFHQVWPELSDRDQMLITALAIHENYQDAANSLGMTKGTYSESVRKARHRFLSLWYSPDPVPPQRKGYYIGKKNHVSQYAPCGTISAFRRHRENREYIDPSCEEVGREYERERAAQQRVRNTVRRKGSTP